MLQVSKTTHLLYDLQAQCQIDIATCYMCNGKANNFTWIKPMRGVKSPNKDSGCPTLWSKLEHYRKKALKRLFCSLKKCSSYSHNIVPLYTIRKRNVLSIEVSGLILYCIHLSQWKTGKQHLILSWFMNHYQNRWLTNTPNVKCPEMISW